MGATHHDGGQCHVQQIISASNHVTKLSTDLIHNTGSLQCSTVHMCAPVGIHVSGQDSQSRRGLRRPPRAWRLPLSPPPPADWPPLSAPLLPSHPPSSLHQDDSLTVSCIPSFDCAVWRQQAWQHATSITSYCCSPQPQWPGLAGFVMTLVPEESITCSDELLGCGRPGLPDVVPPPCGWTEHQ